MTKNGKTRKRLWALLLSAALIVTQLPAVAMAENHAPEDGSIASFEELNSGVAKQTVDVGTELSELNLPDAVTASVCHVTEDMVIPDEDGSDENSAEESDDPATASPSDAENRVSEGKYVFTADVDGSALSDSAKLPQITVTVAADTVEKPTESQPGEPISCTQTEGCTLANGHEGNCVTEQPPANDALVKTITGWTFVDDENLNEGVLPLINVSMDPQADFDTVVSMLPKQISVSIEGEADPATVNITGWACPEYIQDGEDNWPVSGAYTFTAALTEGYACDPLPTAKVLLGGADTYAINNTVEQGGIKIVAINNGEVEYTVGSGFTLKASGTYKISGEWNGTLDAGSLDRKKAVITVLDGITANVTLNTTAINVSSTPHACAFAVEAGGMANITLQGTNAMASGHSRAGLEVPKGASVTIAGSGSLTATGGVSAAGIGSSNGYANQYERDAGNITISGEAEVTAQGGKLAAGIGGGNSGSGGTIEIRGGKVNATGGNNGAGIGGGDIGGEGGTIEISGDAEVTAQGGDGAAGIGGGNSGDGGHITIRGGTVTAIGGGDSGASSGGAGIGGGRVYNGKGNGGTIEISGGKVSATGGGKGAGIGGGGSWNQHGGSGGQITIRGGIVEAKGDGSGAGIGGGGMIKQANGGEAGTIEINGDTVVFATAPGNGAHIGSGGNNSEEGTNSGSFTEGVVFEGEQGTVHGSPKLPGDVTIPNGSTLTVPDGATLTIPDGTTLTNNGTMENNGTISGGGPITNNGTVNDHSGGINVTVNGTNAVNKPSEVEITFWNSQNGQITQAAYGDAIKITAAAQRIAANTLARGAVPEQVDFYIGTIVPEHRIGTANVATDSSTATATLEITLSGEIWNKGFSLGVNTIIADFGGADALNLLSSTGTANLTVEMELLDAAAKITAPATGAKPEMTATVDSNANYTVQKVTWIGSLAADGSFDDNTAYTAEITLNAKQYYRFATFVTGTINNQTASVNRKSDTEAVLSYTFDKTASKPTWAVTVNSGTSDKTAAAEGETVAITAENAPAGQTFDKWTTVDGVLFATENTASTTFIMPAKAVTVTATYKSSNSGGSSGGGGSSSGGSSNSESKPQNNYTVTGSNISRNVSRSDLKKLADSSKSLTLRCEKASMTFDPAALKAILAAVPATAGNITFAASPADLSAFPDAAAQIGTRPVYDFTISYKDSKGNPVVVPVSFPTGSASISLNYILAAAEVTGSLFMVYVNGEGAVIWLDKSSYDNGKVLAEVPHFSTYGVAYKAPAPVFTDIANHWAKADIEFVAARGLLSDTGNNLFSPDGTMTRGMFVTALGRLAGINPDSYQTRSFTDVKADAYYAAYVEWAAQKNIVKGIGEGLFSPDAPVTREQMAVMMTNYAGQMGYSIPTPLAAAVFADNANISEWAAKEVAAMQRAGIIKGKDGNRFDPQASATRAEVSAVLRRFVEIVIDPVTAQGWVKNDSGQWLYYKVGKALTGWQTISKLRYFFNADGVMHEGWKQDTGTNKWYYWTNAGAATGWKEIGGKWYYFDENGVMSVNTTIDGYEIGPDGAKK